LATVVLAAMYGLLDFPALLRHVRVLRELQAELVDHGILLRIFVLADRCAICFDADGIEDEVGRLDRTMTLDGLIAANLQV
jgi:hypothetical protein